jgi:hypothetical protein
VLHFSSIKAVFPFQQTNTCGSSIPAHSSCTVSVKFGPTTAGVQTGAVQITDDASNSPQYISLSGNGTGGTGTPPVALSSTSLSFGSQAVNTVSSARTVLVLNQQSVVLHFSSIKAVFPFQQTNTCGSSIPVHLSCTVSVKFGPTTVGAQTGAVQITDDASNSPQYISLSGSGITGGPTPTPTPTPSPGRRVSVLTYHYDNSRTGANTKETILTPANVNKTQFGKLFSIPVESGIYTQPLYVPSLPIPGLGTHNVVYVATQHNSVYAFDADNGATLWTVNLGPYQTLPYGCEEPGDMGVVGTPVIDRSNNTLYAVAATLRSGQLRHEIHALDITTGAERSYSPVVIKGSTPGTGYGSVGGIVTFDSFNTSRELQRPALTLDNGVLYVGFAVSCDAQFDVPGHGWFFAYNESSLTQKGFFVTSPNGYGGDIWAAGGGPPVDANHNIYFSTGNGDFNVNKGGKDYGDTLIKLSPSLSPLDYFTPFDQGNLEANDADLGSGGTLLLPDQTTSPTHLLVTAGKEGRIYVVNRDNLGKYNTSTDNVVQFEIAIGPLFSTPTFWNNNLYFSAWNDHPKAFSFVNGRLKNGPVNMWTSEASEFYPFPGAVMVVSANGQTNGILWALEHGGGTHGNEVLHAYDATNLANELYNSDQAGTRDLPGVVGNEFISIIVANGKVYVPTTAANQLSVFGLLH